MLGGGGNKKKISLNNLFSHHMDHLQSFARRIYFRWQVIIRVDVNNNPKKLNYSVR
jgi:hypothetical protein